MLVLAFTCTFGASVAGAQPPTTTPPPPDPPPVVLTAQTPSTTDDDPAALDPLEADFSIVNLPTTLRLPVHKWDFHLTHRFNQNLICEEFEENCFGNRLQTLFGIDTGANIGLEFRFGVARNLQAIVLRTSLGQIIQMSLQYDAWHQNANRPLSISGIASIEGDHNFGASTPDNQSTHYSPALGLVVSRKFGRVLAVYVEPFWVHNTAAEGLPTRDTGFLGIGGRLRLSSTVQLVGDIAPRIGGLTIRDPEFGFAIEKRVGGHVFSLTFTNSPGTTFRQIASGGNPDTLNLGFNISRKFY
jgi:Membrane bound beta barrel domain (DUF5777)